MTYKSEILKGKKWMTIARMDISDIMRLNKDDLRVAVDRLSREANRRLITFKSLDLESPATSWAERSGGAFTSKGKSFNQLRSEFRRAKEFLAAETSSLEGYRRIQGEVIEGLMKEDVEITHEDYEKFWKAYEKLKSQSPEIVNREYKYKVMRHIAYLIQDKRTTAASIARRLEDQLDAIYREKEGEKDDEYYGVSQYFKEI